MKGQTTTARARGEPDIAQALMDAVDAIADMAQRVQLNGPEATYASEKLAHACTRPPRAWPCAGSRFAKSPAMPATVIVTVCM